MTDFENKLKNIHTNFPTCDVCPYTEICNGLIWSDLSVSLCEISETIDDVLKENDNNT